MLVCSFDPQTKKFIGFAIIGGETEKAEKVPRFLKRQKNFYPFPSYKE